MLTSRHGLTFGVALVAVFAVTPASAGLTEFGDAMADVVTFGAFGQQRDQHRAEIDQLKAHFAEELQREKNSGDAAVHTAQIEEKVKNAYNSQIVGQQLLVVISEIRLVEAQMKVIVQERFKIKTAVTRYGTWFDSFGNGDSAKLKALLDLLEAVTPGDDKSVKDAIEAAKLDQAISGADAEAARKYLRVALEEANSTSTSEALKTLEGVRQKLDKVVQDQRENIRILVTEMLAEDIARRTLCEPKGIVSVSTGNDGKVFYYSGSPNEPLPCNNGVTFLDTFPASAVAAITSNPEDYGDYAEFYVDLSKIGTRGTITVEKYLDPPTVFGKELDPDQLLPATFLKPRNCADVERYAQRLNDGLDQLSVFEHADDRSAATREVITHALSLRPMIAFWLGNLVADAPSASDCRVASENVRKRQALLRFGVAAIESYGVGLMQGAASTEDAKSLSALDAIAKDF